MELNDGDNVIDDFKIDFKYYKQRASKPSFDNVVDFDKPSSLIGIALKVALKNCNLVHKNMMDVDEWNAYHLESVPGFYFIKNVFSKEHQLYWAERCVQDFTHSPYVTNLDQFQEKLSIDKMWEKSKSTFSQSDSFNLKDTPIWSVRWATLGYHHNWNTRNYSKCHRSDVPDDVARMSINVAHALGFQKYKAEASVVNFYHESSSLCPHQDLSEVDLSFPLISVSFGLDAIFLIGSDVKTSKPTAIFIRSGDVVVMSGQSRTAYHALPRVMSTSKLQLDDKYDFLSCYLRNSRINLNVRQVFPKIYLDRMVLLENDTFLIELTTLYQKTRSSGSVNLTMKKYDGRTKPTPKPDSKRRIKPPSAPESFQQDLCLIRASNGKKKISTIVAAKDINKFQMAYTSVLRANFDALKKRERKKAKGSAKPATSQ